jgi:diaminohydroxyphosphoribosylaminopyrimidine deaminase / 5-amino-6-(5-phosphoribosylamino)uracil reductase
MDEARWDSAWRAVLAAARYADELEQAEQPATFAVADDGELQPVQPGADDAMVAWRRGEGWTAALASDDPCRPFLDLYLPIASATAMRPMTVGHLGQSLDGFIATHAGESRFVTGQENILHLHRLRALCDAVVVGAGTVAADDPQLTTRLVEGPNPLRVVIDPARRLGADHRVFQDNEAETIYLCAQSLTRPDERQFGSAAIVGIEDHADGPGSANVTALMQVLRARGCRRVFVEGGGVTVSMFLEANLLDRLHVAIAPLIIGDGRPAIRLPARALLGDCHRPRYRVFRMGGDVLFDCELGVPGDEGVTSEWSPVTRVI